MKQEIAETRALQVLGWLAGEEDLLPVFMGATGVGEADLRARAAEPELLASVLDFVLMDDQWVMSAASALGWPPQDFVTVRTALPGGHLPNWT